MHPEILTAAQLNVLKRVAFLSSDGFYLAGGTALALQLGHRTSIDFDFYHPQTFDSEKLRTLLAEAFGDRFEERHREEGTLITTLDGIHASFFAYRYPLIRPLVSFEGVSLASVEDIAAMKVVAIVQRGKRRDFIDVYYLLQKNSLKSVLSWVQEKFPSYNPYLCLRALIYFDDAEKERDEGRIVVFDKTLSWKDVKRQITQAVREYQLGQFVR